MDSKIVSKGIKELIRPELEKHGFAKFTSRTAWRHRENIVDVVNFQSFSPYLANGCGVTTFSFSVNLGCIRLEIPLEYGIKLKKGLIYPKEHECTFRGSLLKSIIQNSVERSDIWYVEPDGSNLESCLVDSKEQFLTHGIRWFDRLNEMQEIRRILKYDDEDMSLLWGFGNSPSPRRSYLLACTELILGNESEAREHFKKAIESGLYKHKFETVDEALATIAK